MKELIVASVNHATNLEETKHTLLKVLQSVKIEENPRISYVAGMITSDGPEHITRNIEILRLYTSLVRLNQNTRAFCASDIFGHGLYDQLEEMKLSYKDRELKFATFWRGILSSGYVSDIFMTPRWEVSNGAKEEHEVALDMRLNIHYISPLISSARVTTI